MKLTSIIFIIFLSFSSFVYSTPKGKGFDVIYPVPVSDPDVYHDDGSIQASLSMTATGDRSAKTFYFSYALSKPTERSVVNLNLLWFDYSFSKNSGTADGSELHLGLSYNRILIQHRNKKTRFETQWIPSKFNLSTFAGLGVGTSKIDIAVQNFKGAVNAPHPDLILRRGQTRSGDMTMFPVQTGLIADWSLTKRHGLQTYLHLGYDFGITEEVYQATQGFSTNLGFNYYFRRKSTYFPFEWSAGLILTPQVNDIDSSMGVSLNFGYRRHW